MHIEIQNCFSFWGSSVPQTPAQDVPPHFVPGLRPCVKVRLPFGGGAFCQAMNIRERTQWRRRQEASMFDRVDREDDAIASARASGTTRYRTGSTLIGRQRWPTGKFFFIRPLMTSYRDVTHRRYHRHSICWEIHLQQTTPNERTGQP